MTWRARCWSALTITASTFRSLKDRHSIQASLEIVPIMHVVLDDTDGELGVLATTPSAHWLPSETLARIAEYGLDLDIDEYVHEAEPDTALKRLEALIAQR
ncbi:MAG: hypothetical protein R2742_07125 [Micropruina glycogenica]